MGIPTRTKEPKRALEKGGQNREPPKLGIPTWSKEPKRAPERGCQSGKFYSFGPGALGARL